jgi:hypothetical protein
MYIRDSISLNSSWNEKCFRQICKGNQNTHSIFKNISPTMVTFMGEFYEIMWKKLPHRDNVTAPHGRPNLRSRLHFGHNREGRPRSP